MSSVNQWRDIDWYIHGLKTLKKICVLIQYDIEEFYPSISEDFLKKVINYARTFVNVNSDEEKTIMHFQESLLFNNSKRWFKKRATRILMLLCAALTAQKFVSWLVFISYIY